MMLQFLVILQVIISVTLVTLVLLQSQGSGLGAAWGGGGETYHTRRGLEKIIFYATIVSAVLFTISSIALLIAQM